MMTKVFSKNSNFDLTLDPLPLTLPINLKRKLAQATVISNIAVKLYQNRLINEGARTMIKGEHVCHLRGHISAIISEL